MLLNWMPHRGTSSALPFRASSLSRVDHRSVTLDTTSRTEAHDSAMGLKESCREGRDLLRWSQGVCPPICLSTSHRRDVMTTRRRLIDTRLPTMAEERRDPLLVC